MSDLGFRWVRQTVTEAERPAGRKITVEELIGLSVALGVPVEVLIPPPPGGPPVAALPGGRRIVFRGTAGCRLTSTRSASSATSNSLPARTSGPGNAEAEATPQVRRVISRRDGGQIRVEPAEEG